VLVGGQPKLPVARIAQDFFLPEAHCVAAFKENLPLAPVLLNQEQALSALLSLSLQAGASGHFWENLYCFEGVY